MNIYQQKPMVEAFAVELALRLAADPLLCANGLCVYLRPDPDGFAALGSPRANSPLGDVTLAVCREDRLLLTVQSGDPSDEAEPQDGPVRRVRVCPEAFEDSSTGGVSSVSLVLDAVTSQFMAMPEALGAPGRHPDVAVLLTEIRPTDAEYPALASEHAIAPVEPSRLVHRRPVRGAIPTKFGFEQGLALRVACAPDGTLRCAPCAVRARRGQALERVKAPRLIGVTPLKEKLLALRTDGPVNRDNGALARAVARMPLEALYKGNAQDLRRMRELAAPRPVNTVGEAAQFIRDACAAADWTFDERLTDALDQLSEPLTRMRRGVESHE